MRTRRKSNNKIEILIAEDSPTQAAQLTHLLEEHGYAVTAAANGREALALHRKRRPALVISDVLMPELDGYGLCKEIRKGESETGRHTPVMLVTTLADPLDVIRGLECGADNFIRKPYDEKYLLSRIEYLLMNLELRKNQKMQMGLEIDLGGQRYFITSERQQILDLLISTYEQAVRINDELKTRERELAHSNEVLAGLYRIADGLNRARSEREVAELAVERATGLPGVQAGWISLREGESGFRLAASYNLPPALREPGALEGDCACRRRLLSGELESATNILECERLRNASGDTRGLLYHASVPLWIGDRILGVMNLVGQEKGMFNEDDLHVLYSIGNELGVALERARLREHLEKVVEERTASLEEEIAERSRAEERYRLLFNSSPHPLWVFDVETLSFLAVNDATVRHYGYSRDEFLQRTIKDIRPPEDVPFLLQALRPEEKPLARSFGVFKHRKKDGTPIDVEIVSSAIQFGGREARLVLALDVTEKRRIEEEKRRMERQLEQTQRVNSLGRVAATIAHEFNNVLMGIQPFAEVIRRTATDDPKIQKSAEQIISSVARGKRVTQEILRFTQPSEPDFKTVVLFEWLQQLLPELRGLVGNRIAIEVDAPEKNLTARCDAAQIQQVVTNLVLNARDAMPGEGTIAITIASPDPAVPFPFGSIPEGMVFLSVRDTGSGMPAEVVRQIFEPLFTTKRTGTGLGLAVAQQVIMRHGGSIHVDSAPGEGTTFFILLPSAAREEQPLPRSGRRARRVLLVEDQTDVAAGIVALLESEGIGVRTVALGQEAADAVRSYQPDVVILDLGLPDMSGIEVYAELKLSWPELPVLFSTGRDEGVALERQIDSPRVAFLHKPYDLETLLEQIERVMSV